MHKRKQVSAQQKILKNNLNTISKYNPTLEKKIFNHKIETDYHFETSISGENVLYRNDSPIDDAIDPVWLGENKYNTLQYKKNNSITVILGMDSGYILREIISKYKGKIIIHEPDMDNLKVILGIFDFSRELQNKNIMITNTDEDLEKAFNSLFFVNYHMNIVYSSYYSGNKKFIKEFETKVKGIYELFQSNYKNLFGKNRVWTVSLFNNIPQVLKNQDLHELENSFKNKTAVIISAGPSLDKNIQDLKPYRDKVVVFCVGTALKAAVKYGIIPDFVAAIDISPNTKTQLDIPELADINVIASCMTFTDVFGLKAKRFLNYYGSTTPAVKWLGEVFNAPVQKYHEAGTVSLTAFYSAKILGFKKIVFIGQDLAYTDNRCYSQDSIYGDYKLSFFKNINVKNLKETVKKIGLPEESINRHKERLGKNLIKVKGQNGKSVLTRPDFMHFIKYFEKIANEYGHELKLVNSTEGGAFLGGFEHITLKEALTRYSDEDSINVEDVLKTFEMSDNKIAKRKKIITEKLNEIIKNYDESSSIIVNSAEKNILPFLNQEVKEILNIINSSEYVRILFKKLRNGLTVTEEEKQFFQKITDTLKQLRNALKSNIDNLYESSLEDFYRNYNLVKKDFTQINAISERNAYIKNIFIGGFYLYTDRINNIDNKDKRAVKVLSLHLNNFILLNHAFGREYMKKIHEVLANLEQV